MLSNILMSDNGTIISKHKLYFSVKCYTNARPSSLFHLVSFVSLLKVAVLGFSVILSPGLKNFFLCLPWDVRDHLDHFINLSWLSHLFSISSLTVSNLPLKLALYLLAVNPTALCMQATSFEVFSLMLINRIVQTMLFGQIYFFNAIYLVLFFF